MIFFLTCLIIEFGQIKQKVENGSCSRHSCVNQHDFKCIYDIPYDRTIVSYNFGQKKFKIHILPISGQTYPKTAIVGGMIFLQNEIL